MTDDEERKLIEAMQTLHAESGMTCGMCGAFIHDEEEDTDEGKCMVWHNTVESPDWCSYWRRYA